MSSEELEAALPNLSSHGYSITSEPSIRYNCFAWAAGLNDRWVDVDFQRECFWIEGVPINGTLSDFAALYEQLGFERCEGTGLEPGLEKLALYAHRFGEVTHAARQLASGTWTSKCGALEDIEHDGLEALSGDLYGDVAIIMSRRLGPAPSVEWKSITDLFDIHEWFVAPEEH